MPKGHSTKHQEKKSALKLEKAAQLFQQGWLQQSEQIAKAILRDQPRQLGALELLAAVSWRLKDYQAAMAWLERAIRIFPNVPSLHINRGHVLREVGQFNDAIESYGKAIFLTPDVAALHYYRGIAHCSLKQFQEGVEEFDAAIKCSPESGDAYFARGEALIHLGRFEAALADLGRTIQYRVDFSPAYARRGIALMAVGKLDESVDSFDKAISLSPLDAASHSNRATALIRLGRFDTALISCDEAIKCEPMFADAHLNRGVALMEVGGVEDAVKSFDQALAIDPALAEAYSGRGNAMINLGMFEAAIRDLDAAINVNSRFVDAYANRGVARLSLGRPQSALDDYNQALHLDDQHATAHWNKSIALLASGRLIEGWAEYEWRWKCVRRKHVRFDETRLWLGDQSLAGKTILLHAEQGLGDTIQFCRYVRHVAECGASVILEVYKPLIDLLAGLQGVSQLVARGDPLPLFDFHCPLLSLPLAFRTDLDNIPAEIPYIAADAGKVSFWREKIDSGDALKAGIVWSGGVSPDNPETWFINKRRNIPLALMASLEGPKRKLFSLQKGDEAKKQLEDLRNGKESSIVDYSDELVNFADTAAVMECLDLIITVDTSTAHLAGALGKPVWLLNRFDTCWRWMLDRSDSPWYPSMKLYRQGAPGDWHSVVAEVRRALEEEIRNY